MDQQTQTISPLPVPDTADGTPRLTGVEVEFSGLDEDVTADVLARALGGRVTRTDAHDRVVEGTALGDFEVMLDTALRKFDDSAAVQEGLSLARGIVPVEVVSPPLDVEGVRRFDAVIADLRAAGARGSRAGLFLGFGVHLNPEVVAEEAPHTIETIRAYGFMEQWLRQRENIDGTRRLLPFVRAWPEAYVSDLASASGMVLSDLMRMTARHFDSRNHGLDLLPLFKQHDADLFGQLFPEDTATSARPTFHFRLPDSRIDEAGWSLARPWALWHTVETVAANPALMDALLDAWRAYEAEFFGTTGRWVTAVDDILRDSFPEVPA